VCADLYALEVPPASYDVVVEHALLHHLKDYEAILAKMAAAVKPGGGLFLGYEPDRVIFRSVGPLRKLYRAIFSERRVQDVNAELESEELEALAEYHQFFRPGLPIREIKRRLVDQGFEVRVFHPGISFLAQLQDRSGIPFPSFLPALPFPSTSFHLAARRR
jgi:SAM-dependent methyltransferase